MKSFSFTPHKKSTRASVAAWVGLYFKVELLGAALYEQGPVRVRAEMGARSGALIGTAGASVVVGGYAVSPCKPSRLHNQSF
ncbi:hypothetical protein V8F06_005732 [Rhypophila decipiens]